jgi:hypothetical protein
MLLKPSFTFERNCTAFPFQITPIAIHVFTEFGCSSFSVIWNETNVSWRKIQTVGY